MGRDYVRRWDDGRNGDDGGTRRAATESEKEGCRCMEVEGNRGEDNGKEILRRR